MALGKTVTYTPFQETSFGYGSSEIATAHSSVFSNATDIVKVIITHSSGNWDNTGHLSTPSSGKAVAVYHEDQSQWVCEGQRDHVDAVLDTLSFFPADKPQSRPYNATTNPSGFQTVALKANQTTASGFADEEPPAIGNTVFSLKVYNGASVVSSNVVTFDPTEPTTGNQRPFFSVVPPTEDLNSTAHDTVAGGLVNLGTISHGSDTENVRVKCAFRYFGTGNTIFSGTFGVFTDDDNIFIGDKKPATRNFSDGRFDFTGSVAEAQAFLDNVRYYGAGNQTTFDMYLTISDGVVGSEYTKTVYFSDALISVTNIPDVHYIEDQTSVPWDFGNLSITNIQPDVTEYKAIITLDSTGTSGTSAFVVGNGTTVDSQSFSSGVLTITDASLTRLKAALRNLEFTPVTDFNSSFNMTVDFTFRNPTLGTTYSATQQTVAVTGQDIAEVTNLATSHTYTEDQTYDFNQGIVPQITHQHNDDFDVVFTINSTTQGVLGRNGNAGFFRAATGGFKLSGARDFVNTALQNLFFVPAPDFDSSFTINYTVDRTSGDLTHQTQDTGSFSMSAIALPDFTSTPQTFSWANNESTKYDSNLLITDTAVDNSDSVAFNSEYTVEAKLINVNGGTFTSAKLLSTNRDTLTSNTGLGTTYTMVGTKNAINQNLANMKMVPDPLYTGTTDFFVEYKITRNLDGGVLLDFTPSHRTTFSNPTINADFSLSTPLFEWPEDFVFNFDSTLEITEKLDENKEYTTTNGYSANYFETNYKATIRSKYWDGSASQPFNSLTWGTSSDATVIPQTTVTGTGTDADPLIITGPKTEVNTALATLKFRPNTPDLTGSPATNGGFWIEGSIERVADTTLIINFNPPISRFNSATDSPEYLASWPLMQYAEDIQDQRIFSHLTPVLDGAGDLFNAEYTVTITMNPATVGSFEAYVDPNYVVTNYVSSSLVAYTGTKAQVNAAIQNTKFTPVTDGNADFTIIYDQRRTINGTTVIHANAVDNVGTVDGQATAEFVLGTSNQNKQYFVRDEDFVGVDIRGRFALSTEEAQEQFAAQRNINGNLVNLTSKQLSENMNYTPDRAITITDTAIDGGPSLYRLQFTGGTLFTPLGATLNVTDTGFQLKQDIHDIIEGLYVTGVNETANNIPEHGISHTANFTLHRRTYTGTETQIGQGTLNFTYLSGLQLWTYLSGQINFFSTYKITEGGRHISTIGSMPTLTRIDNLPSGSPDVQIQTAPYNNPNHIRTYLDPEYQEIKFLLRDSQGFDIEQQLVTVTPPGAIASGFEPEVRFETYVRFYNVAGNNYTTNTNGVHQFQGLNSTNFEVRQKAEIHHQDSQTNLSGRWLDVERTAYTSSAQQEVAFLAWTDWGIRLKTGGLFSGGNYKIKLLP